MAIALNSSVFDGGPSGENSAYTFPFTNTSGTFLVISVSGFRGRTISALTYNGASLTQRAQYNPDASHHENIWTLASPATGSNTVSITLSGTDAPTFQCSTWTGVSSTGATGTGTTGTSTTPSCSITTTQSNSVIVDSLHSNGTSGVTRTATNTLIAGGVDTAYGTEGGHSQYKTTTTAGATTTSWTLSVSNSWWITSLELKETASKNSGFFNFF